MPRQRISRRGAKSWQPLVLDHDFTERPAEFSDEQSLQQQVRSVQKPGGLVVFVETPSSMGQPRPLTDYTMDMETSTGVLLFYLRSTTHSAADLPHAEVCKIQDIPHGTCVVLGSKLTMPNGPQHGQRMLCLEAGKSMFSVVLWCSIAGNWSHVATFQDQGDYARAWTNATDWNESAMLFMNSHSNHAESLARLFKLGTGKTLSQDKIVAAPSTLDPFQAFLDEPIKPDHSLHAKTSQDVHMTPATQTTRLYTQADHDARNAQILAAQSVQYMTPMQHGQPYHWTPAESTLQFGAVPWYSLPDYGAVQWPQNMTAHGQYSNQHLHYPTIPSTYGDAYSDNQTHEPGSPSTTRSMLRETVMQMPDQARERNKSHNEYRTVLHDPFKVENKVPSPAKHTSYNLSTPVSITSSISGAADGTARHARHGGPPPADESPLAYRQQKPGVYDSVPDEGWSGRDANVVRVYRPSRPDQYTRQDFAGPFFTDDLLSPTFKNAWPSPISTAARERAIDHWWWSGSNFSRHEDYHRTIIAISKTPTRHDANIAATTATISRVLVPMIENLESYISGPVGQRRDYWSRWKSAPEWCCDRTEEGNRSFFDGNWGRPPARLARDIRYNPVS